MKLITRDTDYALRAVCFIAKCKNTKISVADLVRELKMPRPFLRKILQTLGMRGILKSSKGKGGGFLLAKPGSDIFLTDLIKIFQGPLKLNECLFKKMQCPNIRRCALRRKLDAIEQYVVKKLENITVASLL
ncbi:MAG: Rrf2 family transcriptional regulator [Candidatus Omnitrophota bacterium]|nr:Rrf2 family transcriptional regulator [Candidatus Omnitrophota bacterium]